MYYCSTCCCCCCSRVSFVFNTVQSFQEFFHNLSNQKVVLIIWFTTHLKGFSKLSKPLYRMLYHRVAPFLDTLLCKHKQLHKNFVESKTGKIITSISNDLINKQVFTRVVKSVNLMRHSVVLCRKKH